MAAAVYNNVPGGFAATLGDVTTGIPALSLSQEDGTQALSFVGVTATVVSLLTQPASGYDAWNGTSMATPHVSGVAALVWSFNPSWTNHDVRNALNATALDLGDLGRDRAFGYGVVQAKGALCALLPGTTGC